MMSDREDRIRQEAYPLWNAVGRPERIADEYWYRAERVIDHQDKQMVQEERRGEV